MKRQRVINNGGVFAKPVALNPSLQDFVWFASSIPQVETWGYYKFVPPGLKVIAL